MILYKIRKYFPEWENPHFIRCSFVKRTDIKTFIPLENMYICSGACGRCRLYKKVVKGSIMWCRYGGAYRLIFDPNKL